MSIPPQLPKVQKSVIFNTKTSKLSFTTEAPVPSGPSDEHIILVHASAIANGELTWAPYVNWPIEHVPSLDVSGTIVTSVPGSKFQPGDKIYGRITGNRDGGARQYTTIFPSEAALIPSTLSFTDAASVPQSAITAWQALFEQALLTGSFTPTTIPHVSSSGEIVGGDLAKGKRVLVLGAATAVGLMAVQFAKLAGATVYGTASPKNEAYLQELGVDGVIDYTRGSVEDWIGDNEDKKFDVVFDCVGGKSMLDGWTAVKAGGAYPSIVPGFEEKPERGRPEGVRAKWFVLESRGSDLDVIGKFIDLGKVRTTIDGVWKLEEYEEAFKRAGGWGARGKVVLKVGDE